MVVGWPTVLGMLIIISGLIGAVLGPVVSALVGVGTRRSRIRRAVAGDVALYNALPADLASSSTGMRLRTQIVGQLEVLTEERRPAASDPLPRFRRVSFVLMALPLFGIFTLLLSNVIEGRDALGNSDPSGLTVAVSVLAAAMALVGSGLTAWASFRVRVTD